MSHEVTIRRAVTGDAAVLAGHRVGMFRDMGAIHPSQEPALRDATIVYLATAIPSGEYVAWIATAEADRPVQKDGPYERKDGPSERKDGPYVVGGAGLQRRTMLPRPDARGAALLIGEEGRVLNVYVEPPWRRRGIAKRLMLELVEWAAANGIVNLMLNASADGRPLYEEMRFVATNEMRYTGWDKVSTD